MRYAIPFLFAIIFCSNVIAGTINPDIPDDKYLEYGQKHECVMRITGVCNDNLNSFFRGSCVIIDEYYALTAAHVVYNSITQHIIHENKNYPCLIVAVHKKFKFTGSSQYDIALIRLQRPIKLDFYPEIYQDKDEIDKVCSIAGYGFTGNFNTGYSIDTFDNRKRAGSNIIDKIQGDLLIFSVNKKPFTELEFMIAPGDSGGGLFIDNKLAGIHSMVYAPDGKADSNKADCSCSTRLSTHYDWIINTKQTIERILNDK